MRKLRAKNRKNVEESVLKILEKARELINNDDDLRVLKDEYEKKDLKQCALLSTKPKLYICNVDEQSIEKGNKYSENFMRKYGEKNTLIISAEIENQINPLVELVYKRLYK